MRVYAIKLKLKFNEAKTVVRLPAWMNAIHLTFQLIRLYVFSDESRKHKNVNRLIFTAASTYL